jgi:peptidoglycan/xylan/chitin deacetylase (PgdA/CDA1 family)
VSLRYTAIRGLFEAFSLPGVSALVRSISACRGVIFTLHRVLPDDPADFSPNAILQIKPDFLDYTIRRVRALGLDIVTLDEALVRLADKGRPKPFAVFTFDDAYRDNLRYALPVLRRHRCPFTLYVPTALVDGVGEVWWQALEDIIAAQSAIALPRGAESELFGCATLAEKRETFALIYQRMRLMPEPERVALIRELAARYGLDLHRHCRELIMDWTELRTFAEDPLCTLGAHTVHHYELAKLPAEEARNEIAQSVAVIRAQYGLTARHLSYPIGAPVSAGAREFALAGELGFASAVTTRPGGLYVRHAGTPMALPRVSLNGLFQVRRYVDVFATGAVFSLMGRG